jgi:hypothetical protein
MNLAPRIQAQALISDLGNPFVGVNGKFAVSCPLEDCRKILYDPSSYYRHHRTHIDCPKHDCPFCPKDAPIKEFVQR